MPFVPFNNVCQVELFYRQDSQTLENVLHFIAPLTPDTDSLEQLGLDTIAWWNTVIKPICTSNVSLVGVKATSLNSDTAPSVEVVTGLPLAGTAAATSLPNNVTIVVKLLTANRGRSYRGRVYHVGLIQSQVSGNEVTNTFRTALTTAYGTLLLATGFHDHELCVASRVEDGVPRTLGVATVVTGVQVNQTLDSQRRRLPERGR